MNCAETTLLAADECYGTLKSLEDSVKLMGGFGGGMGKPWKCRMVQFQEALQD